MFGISKGNNNGNSDGGDDSAVIDNNAALDVEEEQVEEPNDQYKNMPYKQLTALAAKRKLAQWGKVNGRSKAVDIKRAARKRDAELRAKAQENSAHDDEAWTSQCCCEQCQDPKGKIDNADYEENTDVCPRSAEDLTPNVDADGGHLIGDNVVLAVQQYNAAHVDGPKVTLLDVCLALVDVTVGDQGRVAGVVTSVVIDLHNVNELFSTNSPAEILAKATRVQNQFSTECNAENGDFLSAEQLRAVEEAAAAHAVENPPTNIDVDKYFLTVNCDYVCTLATETVSGLDKTATVCLANQPPFIKEDVTGLCLLYSTDNNLVFIRDDQKNRLMQCIRTFPFKRWLYPHPLPSTFCADSCKNRNILKSLLRKCLDLCDINQLFVFNCGGKMPVAHFRQTMERFVKKECRNYIDIGCNFVPTDGRLQLMCYDRGSQEKATDQYYSVTNHPICGFGVPRGGFGGVTRVHTKYKTGGPFAMSKPFNAGKFCKI